MEKQNTAYDPAALEQLAEKLSFPREERALLQQALTHPAFYEGHSGGRGDNQRLEFLGDGVLDMIVGAYLYQRYPEAHEGDLSKMRAFIVCEASLGEAALELGLERCLRLGRGSEANGDRLRPSVLGDAYEAVVGAVFICQGFSAAEKMLLDQFRERMDRLQPEDYEDKKSLLQEFVQAKVAHGVSYKLLSQSGPSHKPRFVSAAFCNGVQLGQGEGGSKKESEMAAAAEALSDRERWLPEISG
ncbi:MAG: ribonuclease III [Firmicutes bacterium]|nr:ribonuclease III [Bacillota bacterium]